MGFKDGFMAALGYFAAQTILTIVLISAILGGVLLLTYFSK